MNQFLKSVQQAPQDILQKVFDQSTEGFQVIDREWRYVYVNETVARQGLSTVQELTGHTMMEKYPGIENTPIFTQLKKCMNENVSIRTENEFVFPGGQKGWFILFIHPWSGGIMLFSIDITSRMLAKNRLIKKIENFIGAASSEGDRKNLEEVKTELENLDNPNATMVQ